MTCVPNGVFKEIFFVFKRKCVCKSFQKILSSCLYTCVSRMSLPGPDGWKSLLEIDIGAVVGGYFSDDPEFARVVSEVIECVLETGDVGKWSELKRLDAHASKHEKISPDYFLNLVFAIMNRVCCLGDSAVYCERYLGVLFDRMEGFHNQCRDEIPMSVSQTREKYQYLHLYNAQSYGSILSLIGTVLTRSGNLPLGKRIAANHNHWFNFSHIIDFTKSLIEAKTATTELWTHLGPGIFSLVSGLCGNRLGFVVMDSTGVDLSTQIGWIGSLAIDALEKFSSAPQKHVQCIVSALACLASLRYRDPGHGASVLAVLIHMGPSLIDSPELIESVGAELLNAQICILQALELSEWADLDLESATQFVMRTLTKFPDVERICVLCLHWMRAMCLFGLPLAWVSLLALDSPVMDFVLCALVSGNRASVAAVAEVCRVLVQRDLAVMGGKSSAQPMLSMIGVLTDRTTQRPIAPIDLLMKHAFRRCWKACAYILHQCILRGPKIELTQNTFLGKIILDPKWEEQVDLLYVPIDELDLAYVNETESRCLYNYSIESFLAINSVVFANWMYMLEIHAQSVDAPICVNSRLEYWLVHDNMIFPTVEPGLGTIYQSISARLLALFVLHESCGSLRLQLLGLVETATGVLNDDLNPEIVAIDALFMLLDSPPFDVTNVQNQIEYLYALKIVADALDDPVTQIPVLKFVQVRWTHRFTILRSFLDIECTLVAVDQVAELFRVVAVELVVAGSLQSTDAEHVVNMRAFGAEFIAGDIARGRFAMIEYMERAFESLGKFPVAFDLSFTPPELRFGGDSTVLVANSLGRLVDSIAAIFVEYGHLISPTERGEIFSYLIEAIRLDGSNEYQYCIFTKLIPKLLLCGGGPLAFNLRMIRALLVHTKTANVQTMGGILESLCVCVSAFVGTQDVWMLNEGTIAKQFLKVAFEYVCTVAGNPLYDSETCVLPLTLIVSMISTHEEFVDIVAELLASKHKAHVDKITALPGKVSELMKEIVKCLETETIFYEIGI